MSLILDGSTGISGSAGVIDAETFAGQANTYYTNISARLGYTPLSNVSPSYSGTLTGNTGIINIGSGQFYKDANGNVGIGTVSPVGKIDVRGNVFTTGAFIAGANISAPTADASIYRAADNTLAFATGSAEKMRINSSGNVGIGTNSPVNKLDVLGDVTVGGFYRNVDVTVVGAAGMLLNLGALNGSTLTAGAAIGAQLDNPATTGALQLYTRTASALTEKMRITSAGDVGIGTTSPSTFGKFAVTGTLGTFAVEASGAVIKMTRSNTNYLSCPNGDLSYNATLHIFTNANASTEWMRINSSGNVGIGTVSPGTKLEVTGDITQTWAASMDRFVGSKFSTTYELGLHFIESNRETRIVSKAADSTGFISFYTGVTPTERMRINPDGRLLFRTTTLPASSWNTNSLVNIQAGVQLTHTGNAAIWRQLSWSGDTADTALFFPNQAGNVASLSAAGAWTNASDGRLKTNVTDITHGLASVMAAQPRSYTRIDCPGNYIGFVAQELKEVIPEVVLGSEETQYGVDYGSLVAVAFKAIQELKAEFDAYKLSHP